MNTLSNVTHAKSYGQRLSNWSIYEDYMKSVGFHLDYQIKSDIISGNGFAVLELLKQLREKYRENDDLKKSVSVNKIHSDPSNKENDNLPILNHSQSTYKKVSNLNNSSLIGNNNHIQSNPNLLAANLRVRYFFIY